MSIVVLQVVGILQSEFMLLICVLFILLLSGMHEYLILSMHVACFHNCEVLGCGVIELLHTHRSF